MYETYFVSGASFAFDPNIGLIYDRLNPTVTIKYANAIGSVRTRTYQANISMVGLRLEVAFRIDGFFFTNPQQLTFENTDKTILLGQGFEVGLPLLNVAYIPFINAAGGIIIPSLTIGVSLTPLSFISGGALMPIGEY